MGKGSVVSFSGIKVAVGRFKAWKVTFLAIMTLGKSSIMLFFTFISPTLIMNQLLTIEIEKINRIHGLL